MAGTNPVIACYDALWTMLRSKSDFIALFPTSTPHQVVEDTTLTYEPRHDLNDLAPADYPRCRINVTQCEALTERDSAASHLSVIYSVEIASGAQMMNVALNASWAIYRALLGWRQYIQQVVTWNGKTCIEDVDGHDTMFSESLGSWHQQFMAKTRARGTEQWLSLFSIKVTFFFTTADLQNN